MPLTLRDLTSKTKRLAIKVDDDPEAFTVVYRPHNMTAKVEEKVNQATKEGLEIGALIKMVLPVIAEWDLRMDHGAPVVELSEEGLQEVPGDILVLIMDQVTADIKPDPKTETP